MPAEFSNDELSIIGNMMLSKTNKAIACLLDRDISDVAQVIAEIKLKENLSSYQDKFDQSNEQRKIRQAGYQKNRRAAAKVVKKRKGETPAQKLAREQKEVKDALKRQRLNLDEKSRVQRENSRGPKFQTRQVNYSDLHAVRIDSKTIIYIKPGEDEQKARDQFLKTYKKSFKEDQVPKEERTKVCRRCKGAKLYKDFNRLHSNKDGRANLCIDCMREMDELRKRQKLFK